MSETDPIIVDTPMDLPVWAILERDLIRLQTVACQDFFDKYFDERGYLQCVPRWGGDDGPDDAAENLLNWTMLHALGADEIILDIYRKGWEGHLKQYTEAKTTEVPFARDGMYYKEFPVMFDWGHHSEGFSAFFLQGLSDPEDLNYRQRMKRFAGFYMGEDEEAANYDAEHKIIRSMFNGSRGPLLRKATALDWAGDPIQVEGRFTPLHGERSYQEMLDHFRDYNDVVGDHPLNLASTTLAFNSYALTGENKYKEWLIEYVDAWVDRIAQNGGIIPTNIGLDGTLGGACGGKWYGGVYGWGFTVTATLTGELDHRPGFQNRCFYGFGNALLLTGDRKYIDVWRDMVEAVNANKIHVGGKDMYPHMFGDSGWYDYTEEKFSEGNLELYYWSMSPEDLNRLEPVDWIDFLQGKNRTYPVETLRRDIALVYKKIDKMRNDISTPDTRLSDDPNEINPATVGSLIKLMLGGLPTGRIGFPLHCRVRYFDPERQRAGIPEDVASLVEEMTDDEVVLTLVNIGRKESRDVIVQGGAYAEHFLVNILIGDHMYKINDTHVMLRLNPGCGARISLKMKRYASKPILKFPWW